ncbi:LysR family transcriptional regulator [Klebsiella indica]|uniref:LysR family transcriptional regulator n=1 Tax=Klebsiella indica TaxID=2582917 RepID=A0A5R9LDL7_9ENTR|nr:LysR family transcriptional regulator [Klebsiella indica]TLV11513.1 LysR family transcriptional regulator [Klebsiella indica]
MNKVLRDMPLFIAVARHKSFTRAADTLGMPVSTLSSRISSMEKRLGIPLLVRNSRNVEVTESGKIFFKRCETIVAEADDACENLAREANVAAGCVRFAVAGDIYHSYLQGVVGNFTARWPDICLHVTFSSRWVDLLLEPYDLDIRAGILPDSGLRVHTLASLQPSLYCSPSLLKRYPTPQRPADLAGLPCIAVSQQGNVWVMSNGDKKESTLIHPAHTVNNPNLALEIALAGSGITWADPPMVAGYLAAGQLVPVLAGWVFPSVDLSVVMANSQLPKRVRLFVDFLVEHCKKMNRML